MSLLRPSLRRVAQRVLQQHESGFQGAQQTFSAAAIPDPVGLQLAPVSPEPVSVCLTYAMLLIQLSQHCKGSSRRSSAWCHLAGGLPLQHSRLMTLSRNHVLPPATGPSTNKK